MSDETLPAVAEQRGSTPGGVTGKGWLHGRSGNPTGRPKGPSLTPYLRAELDKPDGDTGRTKGEAVAEKLVELAIGGDVAALRVLLDRVDGRANDRTESAAVGLREIVVRYVDNWRAPGGPGEDPE